MSGQPPGASFLPFMTSVTTDIYARIDKVTAALDNVTSMISDMLNNLNTSLGKISKSINEMIEQGEMTKEMTLSAFADTTNNLIEEIKQIRNEQVQGLQGTDTQQLINAVGYTATILEARLSDIQIAILINGVHALINAVKAGKVVGIPVPVRGMPGPAAAAKSAPAPPDLAAPVPTLSATDTGESKQKKSFFGKGARKKTHDEIMEEKRKKDAMFRKYLR